MARANQNKSISMPKPPGVPEGGFSVSPSDIGAGTGGSGDGGTQPKDDRPVKQPPFNYIPPPPPPPPEDTSQENARKRAQEAAQDARQKSGRR